MQIKEIFKSKESRINFLAGLIRISKADGIFEEDEKVFFYNSAKALELDNESIELLNSYLNQDDIKVSFDSKVESLLFFQQAIQLCNMDGEYKESEKKEVQKLREELCISKESIDKIENWVYDGIKWLKEGEKLLYNEK